LKGMPAERAGLKAGDRILAINATSTADMTVEDAVTIIRGTVGTPVKLTIERAGNLVPLEFTIVRETITVPTLDWRMQTPTVAYIKLHNFFGNIEKDFAQAVKAAKAAGMQKIILDLRNNPGGLLDASINIASEFIPAGKTVVSEDFGPGKGKYDFPSYGGTLTQTPVVVLVNGGSASAAEILAGALKDQRGAKLIGEKTFGKGSVQELVQLSGGMSLKVTVAKWLTPSGAMIDQQGITPDKVVPLTDADTAAGKDPQLDEALAVVQTL
ncbi:MAG: S41 family peptidase, partial [Patescibacteria group bacterium]